MDKKVLLFGFDNPRDVLDIAAALRPFGAEPVSVGRDRYGIAIGALTGPEPAAGMSFPGGVLPGRMAVLCGLDNQLDGILSALRRTKAGPGCLKAVLTHNNRVWNAYRLYEELSGEDAAFRNGSAGP